MVIMVIFALDICYQEGDHPEEPGQGAAAAGEDPGPAAGAQLLSSPQLPPGSVRDERYVTSWDLSVLL